jgi:Uma2 family endonuclease
MSMVQSIPKVMTFDEFVAWCPEQSEYRYELHNGLIIQMPKPTGKHSKVAGKIIAKLNIEIDRLQLPYFVPRECVVKPLQGESGYEPDVIVLNEQMIADEPRWERESIITRGQSACLVVEVVSTNWSDDYALKLEDYEALGIPEYWIVDYLGLGGKRYIGFPKQPTLSVCSLTKEGYQIQLFRKGDRIISRTFPELVLTTDDVFAAGQ